MLNTEASQGLPQILWSFVYAASFCVFVDHQQHDTPILGDLDARHLLAGSDHRFHRSDHVA